MTHFLQAALKFTFTFSLSTSNFLLSSFGNYLWLQVSVLLDHLLISPPVSFLFSLWTWKGTEWVRFLAFILFWNPTQSGVSLGFHLSPQFTKTCRIQDLLTECIWFIGVWVVFSFERTLKENRRQGLKFLICCMSRLHYFSSSLHAYLLLPLLACRVGIPLDLCWENFDWRFQTKGHRSNFIRPI